MKPTDLSTCYKIGGEVCETCISSTYEDRLSVLKTNKSVKSAIPKF